MMRQTDTASFVPVVLVLLVLLGTLTGAVAQVLEALDERQVEAAAVELELATHTIATVTAFDESLPASMYEKRAEAMQILNQDLDLALGAVSDADARLAETAMATLLNADETDTAVVTGAAEQLHVLFDRSKATARADAANAERNAARLVVIAAIAGVVASIMLFGSRRREQRLVRTLGQQAATDWLTGLPNRRHLQDALDQARGAMFETGSQTGLLYLDLDGFKNVNDTLGHDAGDQLLTAAAERLTAAKRPNETLVRLGGDEFGVILAGIDSPQEAHDAARRYFRSLDRPCEIRGRQEFLRTSIGVSTTSDPDHVDELRSEADMAMYVAKRDGGQAIEHFSPGMRTVAEAIDSMTRALRGADLDGELFLVFQPIVRVDVNEPLFVEALLRWESPLLGQVMPSEFIPLAEQTGEIHAIGNWVLRKVIEQLAVWDTDPAMQGVSLSCNVSALQLADRNFVANVLELLRTSGVRPDRLILEVTESVALDVDSGAIDVLRHLRSAGLRIAIDDFGSGYSNLGQLLEVPFDILKLDRSLLVRLTEMRDRMGADPMEHCEIMSAISAIARELGAEIVCEGVEHEQQRTSLACSGVTHIQGWVVGKPARAEHFVPVWAEPVLA